MLSGDIVVAINGAILSWPLNLIVAEWLIRRTPEEARFAPVSDASL